MTAVYLGDLIVHLSGEPAEHSHTDSGEVDYAAAREVSVNVDVAVGSQCRISAAKPNRPKLL